MKFTLFMGLALLPLCAGAAEYSVSDAGGFAPAGHRVEFSDRYGWESYRVCFDFSLEASGRALSKDSKLSLKILKRDGKTWDYACRAKGRDALTANINFLNGRGISVVAECRIDEEEFAEAVGLNKEDVGLPNLVFHAMIQDGKVTPGAQRGLYFLPAAQIESSELNAYAWRNDDPSSLAVLFRSN